MPRVFLGSPVNRSHPLAYGLANAWIPLVGAGGTTLFDVIGRNHGTLTNGPTWDGESSGLRALSYDGSDDQVSFTAVSSQTHTWGIRFFRTRLYPEAMIGQSGAIYRIGLSWGENEYRIQTGGVDKTANVAGGRGNGQWQTLVVINRPSAECAAVLNGVKTVLEAAGGTATASYTLFGDHGAPSPFQGKLQSLWFWPLALSDSQAAAFCAEADTGFPTLLTRRRRGLAYDAGGGGGGNAVAWLVA